MNSLYPQRGLVALLATATLALGGCASLPAQAPPIPAPVQADGRPADLATLLAAPLTQDQAVAVAMANNPRLRVLRGEFARQVADIDAAVRPGGPTFSWSSLRPDEGVRMIALALSIPLTDWLTAIPRARVAAGDRAVAAQQTAWATQQLQAEVREAWVTAVAARERAARLGEAAEVADLSAELAGRFIDAGNLTRAEWAREQAQSAEARLARATAERDAAEAWASLATLLGLSSADPRLQLPAELPPPPAVDTTEAALEARVKRALGQRLDLAAAQGAAVGAEARVRYARRYGFLPQVAAGAERERETDGEWLRGPSVEVEIPLAAGPALRHAAAELAIARAERDHLELEVANEVRLRHGVLVQALAAATEFDQRLLPLQATLVQEAQKEQAFMLIGAFDLLATRRVALAMAADAAEQRAAAWQAAVALSLASGELP